MSEQSKRPYKRLTPSVWAEIRALWETGEVTLAELADRYGVRTRTLQAHFDKHGTQKAAKAKEIASAVQAQIYAAAGFDLEARVQLGKEAQASSYGNAVAIERLIMAQLQEAQTSPANAFKAATAIKTLSLAAQALERVNGIKRSALGLDNLPPDQDELTVLQICELTEDEVEAIRSAQENDYPDAIDVSTAEGPAFEEGSDVVEEGGPEDQPAISRDEHPGKKVAAEIKQFGGRLVRANFTP